jgi:SRSO17 transposase
MDAKAIVALGPRLNGFLGEFSDCFGRREPAEHLATYVRGQLSDLPRKSIEPIALHFDTPPRTLQQFLSRAHWDQERMRDRLQERVAARHTHRDAVGIIDEGSYVKKGKQTPGVKRQYCGASGKKDNCTVSVHLAYAAPGGFRALLDGELFVPEDWSDDRKRCRQAGIPEDMVYRPKWKIALELRDRAMANGVTLPWLTFDEGYGRVPEFHQELDQRGQWYVAEVPRNFYGWCKRPVPLHKEHHPNSRREWKVKNPPASRVDDLARHSPAFTRQAWKTFYIKDSEKGPVVWQAKFAVFYISRDGQPGRPHWLIVARNAQDPSEVKYFVSNAPLNTPHTELLRVGFSRYAIERCFEDDKTEVGLDHFEVRNYLSLKRHLIISALSLLFLAEVHQEDRGEKSGIDGLPGADGGQRHDLLAVDDGPEASGISRSRGSDHRLHAAKERRRPHEPPQGGSASPASTGHQSLLLTALSP